MEAGGTLIDIRTVTVGSRRVSVLLFRNVRGGVSAEWSLGGGKRAVIDGHSTEEALAVMSEVLELSLLAHGEELR